MEEVLKIINQLQATSSRNEKEAILEQNKDNELLRKVLKYTYSGNLQYGFSEKKLREMLEDLTSSVLETWKDGFEMLDELANSNINDILRSKVRSFLSNKSAEEVELWIKILTKDLRCNITEKTINKVIKGLIDTWEIQQAYSIDKIKLKKNEWIALSLKLNGIRTTDFKDTFRSRQNKEMFGYDHILNDIHKIDWLKDYVVDGELIRKNIDGVSDNENFRLTASIVNSDAAEKPEIEMVIFDLVLTEEFIRGESSNTFKQRLIILDKLSKDIKAAGLKNIRIAPTYYTGTDHSQIGTILDEVDAEGLEGLMCLRDVPYKTKRHNGILKCKKFKEGDFRIVGFEEGNGKLKGTLGSLMVEFKGNTVGVSGYTDEMRKELWDNQEKYLEKIITVKYKEESKDKDTGMPSLQFPTFVMLRLDKTEPNY